MITTSEKLSAKEKVGYALGDFATNLVFQILVTYLAYFYTDIYGLKPKEIEIVDKNGNLLLVGDNKCCFFEAA